MVIWTSLQACGVVLPFAISTSICRSSVTICSGLYLLIDMTGLPPQVNSLSFHLVQKSPVRSLRGRWGFEPFVGPSFHLRSAHSANWIIPPADRDAVIVGRDDSIHLQSPSAACVEKITVATASGEEVKTTWKIGKADELELQIPLKDKTAGVVKLKVKQYGLAEPD